MEFNAISWSDIEAWKKITGAEPDLWEIDAIYRMGLYRVNPNFDPTPIKTQPVSLISQLKTLQASYQKEPNG